VFGKLELKTAVVVVAPPQRRVKVCPSSPKKHTLVLTHHFNEPALMLTISW